MATTTALSYGTIKHEYSPEPDLVAIESVPLPPKPLVPAVSPKDPENFLKQCSGYSKKTKSRCSAPIGRRAQKDVHPIYLPTCGAHRDQQSLAGWCQFKCSDGEKCGRLFRWSPPHFELCNDHQGHPSTPCYFLKQLPLELRHEIYRYLIPTEPIDSSTAAVHDRSVQESAQRAARPTIQTCVSYPSPMRATRVLRSKFPMRLLDLLLVSRQVHDEVKDRLFSTVTFKIDIRKDGTFMCGRRLLEPKRADGSSHFLFDEADHAKRRFLTCFDWASAKNYAVDILLENCPIANPHNIPNTVNLTMKSRWDEQVEIYDIRDYISVVVSGILAKAKNLYKLQVRLCLTEFPWAEDQILSNAKLLFNPFERLRNVRQPTLGGVFSGRPDSNSMYPIERGVGRCSIATGSGCMPSTLPAYYELCSVPSLPTDNPVLSPGIPAFDAYAAEWSRQISSEGSANVIQEPPIRKMFTEFRNFYTEFAQHVPDITLKSGRHTFLHRARVAREQEDVIAFRAIRTELLEYWKKHLEDQERKKRSMEARIARFLQSDKYPSHVWEESSPAQSSESLPNRSPQSPIVLDSDVMARDGIPMTGNSVRRSCPQPHYRQMNQQPTHQYLYVEPKLSLDPAERYAFMKRRQLQQEALQQQAQQQQQIQQRRQQEQLQLDNIRQQAIVQTEQQNGHASIQSRRGSSSSRSSDNSGLAIDNEAEHFSMMREEEEPGPSTKRRRTNSWCHGESTDFASGQDTDGATLHHQMQAACGVKSFGSDADVTQTLFTGKGKGKVRE